MMASSTTPRTYFYGLSPLPSRLSVALSIKRTLDVVISLSLLAALSPFLLILIAIIGTDGSSAIYGHERLGRNGKKFYCLKLRSMVRNSDELLKKHLAENSAAAAEWAASHKLKSDPRITPIGKILRTYSLDELPQLINVLKGDMSLVGPRPIVTAETAFYDSDIVHYYRVRPGLTGLWQVSGRNDVSYAARVQMDSWYVKNWSLWQDVVILAKTPFVILKRQGAY